MYVMGSEALTVRTMTRDDWSWVAEWFQDDVLDRELGPLDEDWLEHVLTDESGVQLVVTDRTRPAALIGCAWDPHNVEHAITDIAVDPLRRGAGLGRRALDAVIAWPLHPPARRWIAFVDRDNAAAHRFFTAIAWRDDGVDDDMHRFSLDAARPAQR